jgi:hypothetical protein
MLLLLSAVSDVTCYRLALEACSPRCGPVLVPSDVHEGTFAKKKSGPRSPRPPGGPPVLGSLVWRAEGLPSTRNWPFRLPVGPVAHQPAPGDTQGNVCRQLAGAVVLGGGAASAPPPAGSGRSCAPSFRVP